MNKDELEMLEEAIYKKIIKYLDRALVMSDLRTAIIDLRKELIKLNKLND